MEKIRRFLPNIFLLITAVILSTLLFMQQAYVAFPAKLEKNSQTDYLKLSEFNTTVSHCRYNKCQNEKQNRISLPLKTKTPIEAPADMQSNVVLEHIFNSEELDWLRKTNEVYLYFPRMVHNSTTILDPALGEFTAYAADFYVKTSSSELINTKRLLFEINFTNLPWFGPADLPILIVSQDALASIQEKSPFNNSPDN